MPKSVLSRWVWASMRPGNRMAPAPSMTSAPAEFAAVPIAAMRSPLMVMSVAASAHGRTFLMMTVLLVTEAPFARSLKLGVESVAQPVAEQIDRQDDKAELEGREQHHPPAAGEE